MKIDKIIKLIIYLAFHGCHDAMDLLILMKPELLDACDSSGSLPVHEAVKSGNYVNFQRLLNQGADIKKTDSIGQTILHIGASTGNISVIDYVLKNKLIDISCEDNFGITALAIAQRNKLDNVINLLSSYGAK